MSNQLLVIAPGVSGYMNLTNPERDQIQGVERAGAVISLLGVILIFIAYGLFKRLRTVPNTFIIFASIANVGASIACVIGYDGIMAGDSSALCQIQAFLLEMFMQSDPWWSLAMAVNVYLVFFLGSNPTSFRKYLWIYCLVCFGLPALPAFICLFYAPNGNRIYGNATLWCWIDDRYNQLRIWLYYLPIWTCSVLSAIIYACVGHHVFRMRNQLRNLTISNQGHEVSNAEAGYAEKNQAGPPGSYGMVTTEVQVTNETSDSTSRPSTPAPSITPVLQTSHHHLNHHAPNSHTHPWMAPDDTVDLPLASTSRSSSNPFTTISSITSTQKGHSKDSSSGSSCLPIHTINLKSPHSSSSSSNPQPKPAAALKKRTPKRFLRCASIHRAWRRFNAKMDSIDPIKVAYLRTSFIFAISILVTWTPSSINRVYSFAHPTRTSFGLNMASAVVLPLQGLWNALIFTATSWTALKEEVGALRARMMASRGSQRLSGCGGNGGGALGDAGRWRSGFADQEGLGKSPRGMGNVRVIRGGSL